MNVQHKKSDNKGVFYIEVDGLKKAEMTYVMAGETKMIIDHTEVLAELSGKGAGKMLVEKAVEYARKNGIKILPLCTFAKTVFEKTPDYNDVLF
ncbi:MAG: N-acetyltransferase [Bacteroidetes bacterium]|nr:N-acetyltransferase [Bacteroidota bacterium]